MVAKDFDEPVTFGDFNRRITNIERRIRVLEATEHTQGEQIVSTQADVDALTAALTADDSQLNAAVVAIQAEIAALQNANPALDLSGLTSAVAATADAVTAVAALVPPATS